MRASKRERERVNVYVTETKGSRTAQMTEVVREREKNCTLGDMYVYGLPCEPAK